MLKEAIEAIVGLAKPDTQTVGDKIFSNKNYTEIRAKAPDKPALIGVSTLSAIKDLIEANADQKQFNLGRAAIHVVSPTVVELIGLDSDDYGQRITLVRATKPEVREFQFGKFISHEQFAIDTQACFTKDEDRDYLVKIASNLTAEIVTTSEDDGIGQKVGVRAGVALVGSETLRSRVKLSPYRTFADVVQPTSEFIFRVRQQGEGKIPELALFEADGGKWKVDAMENIGRHLRVITNNIPIII